METKWQTIERPGHFGKKRDEIFRQYNDKYGKDNWRIAWQWDDIVLPYEHACLIYEDGYYADSFKREELWQELKKEAKNVYDHDISNIEAGLDYTIQKGLATHLQDISIRRVFLRRGWKFEGEKLIQIRSHNECWRQNLSPGKVPFHLPEMIVVPHLKAWWDENSIEDFYQSNKVIQIK